MSRALVIVDFQNDFTPGGALAVPEGDEIAATVNELAEAHETVIATRDWHPPDHGSFVDQGGPWPMHCVRDTDGAQLHPSLDRALVDVIVDKGQDPSTEGYSGFEDTELAGNLRRRGANELAICGLATDYCVRNTALDALGEGFAVTVVTDAVRGVDVESGDSERALAEMRAAGARLATSAELLAASGG